MYGRQYSARFAPYHFPSQYRPGYGSSQSAYSHHVPSNYHSLPSNVDYSSTASGLSWSRSNSYSGNYSPYDSETSPYTTQGPNFILPNADPMAASTSYSASTCTSRSQNPLWSDQTAAMSQPQSSSQLLTTGYALPASDSMIPYQQAQNSTVSSLKADQIYGCQTPTSSQTAYQNAPSQQSAALSNDRILPTPGLRTYASSTVSTLESLPMSALSHRSSLGWQTDVSSNSSHLSSQTSCSSAGGSQDFGTDRPPVHRDSTDLAYNFVGYNGSPQSTIPSYGMGSLVSTADIPSSQAILSTLAAEMGPQRCRTVSDDPPTQDSPGATASSSYGYTAAAAGVTRNSQTRPTSGQLSNGATYTRASQSGITRRESGTEDCGADCSGCQPSSARTSIAGINNMPTYG
jgi:hypothetical protein